MCSVQSHNIRLRDLLHSEGISVGLDSESTNEGEAQDKDFGMEREERDHEEQEQEEQKVWKIKGRANAQADIHPRSPSSRGGSQPISRSDSIVATPMSMVEPLRDPKNSDAYVGTLTGVMLCGVDHRSPWERSRTSGETIPIRPRNLRAMTHFGPQIPTGKTERERGMGGPYCPKSRSGQVQG